MAAARPKNKIERAYTVKDIESDDLECTMISKLNMDIYSIDENEMENRIVIPDGVKPHQSWAKGAELEKAFLTHSVTLASDIEKVVSEAKEGNEEALTSPLQKYVTSVCTETYQNLPDGNVPEWVVLAKGQINENLVAKVKTWWTDILTYTQPGKKTSPRTNPEVISFEKRSIIRSIINELNGSVFRVLTACEQKQRDQASLLIVQTLDATAKKASKNEEVNKRLTNQLGKLSSYMYKVQFEKCQKLLKLWDMGAYISNDTTDYRAQASSIFSKIKTLFTDNNLKLPKSTSIEIRGQNRKKEYFILALFSSLSEARAFEHQAAEGRRKNVTKMKTQRMEPQDAEAFPLITWQDALEALKVYATERVTELKTVHAGDNDALAKIEACNLRINDMKCWRIFNSRAHKHFFEFVCPFRPGMRYHTSSLSSPFTCISITEIK